MAIVNLKKSTNSKKHILDTIFKLYTRVIVVIGYTVILQLFLEEKQLFMTLKVSIAFIFSYQPAKKKKHGKTINAINNEYFTQKQV